MLNSLLILWLPTRTLSFLLLRVLVVMARAGNAKTKEIQSFVPISPSHLSATEKTIEIEMVGSYYS